MLSQRTVQMQCEAPQCSGPKMTKVCHVTFAADGAISSAQISLDVADMGFCALFVRLSISNKKSIGPVAHLIDYHSVRSWDLN